MQPTHTQPHAIPITDELVTAILADIVGKDAAQEFAVRRHGEFSNDVAVVTLESGRRMMVKRGRHPWSGDRFEIARRASHLLRRAAGIVAPEPFDLSQSLTEEPVEAYWRIELPLFAEVWSGLGKRERRAAMRSLGELMQRVHAAGAKAGKQMAEAHPEPFSTEALERDLSYRLLPAIRGEWPAALPHIEELIAAAPRVFADSTADAVVLHGDLHLGNVLCRAEEEGVRCVGLLDLEWVHAGPAESDFARFHVMHGGPFDMPVEPECLDWVYEGYESPLDLGLLRFFELYHLLNLGLYSAVIGDDWHAGVVEEAAQPVAAAL